jgi:hypothetical protein
VISNSIISDNRITATSTAGTAIARGAAIVNDGVLELRNDEITRNTATASGLAGSVQGGGIWNGMLFPGLPTPQLTLANTIVMHNALSGSAGFTLQGGGLYTLGFPIALTNSVIANNSPDECFGC